MSLRIEKGPPAGKEEDSSAKPARPALQGLAGQSASTLSSASSPKPVIPPPQKPQSKSWCCGCGDPQHETFW